MQQAIKPNEAARCCTERWGFYFILFWLWCILFMAIQLCSSVRSMIKSNWCVQMVASRRQERVLTPMTQLLTSTLQQRREYVLRHGKMPLFRKCDLLAEFCFKAFWESSIYCSEKKTELCASRIEYSAFLDAVCMKWMRYTGWIVCSCLYSAYGLVYI